MRRCSARGRHAVSQRVLIIDDEAEVRRNLSFGLSQEGYVCTACPDGISAIHELHESREKGIGYDDLITGVFLPDIDGMKLLKVIKSKVPNLPVLIITAFGNEDLESTALAENNTGFLDKPFEIEELVGALKALEPGATTLDYSELEDDEESQASLSSYLSLSIKDSSKDMEVYEKIADFPGVVSCDAVWGDVDIICILNAESEPKMEKLLGKIAAIDGVEVVSTCRVDRPRLDGDVREFIEVYRNTVKADHLEKMSEDSVTKSYVIVDIDPGCIQQVFTTLVFLDEVLVCDVADDGKKVISVVSELGAFGKTPRILEKLAQIDGVLRVKQANIINLRGM